MQITQIRSPSVSLAKVAIVGRPNVGKSSLFNRLMRNRQAIVEEASGTTRDRIYGTCSRDARPFILIDTGGFTQVEPDALTRMVKQQIKWAIEEASILLFVCDAQAGVVPQDSELSQLLRKTDKKVILAANKSDNEKLENEAVDFYQLGLGRPFAVSALHNRGIEECLAEILKNLPQEKTEHTETAAIKVAIVGRPNVGKSSFLNCLLNEERVIVDEAPGTTRDAIDTYFRRLSAAFILIDTAGIQHRRKIKRPVDMFGIIRSEAAIKRSDVCLLIIDGYDGLRRDDLRVFNLIVEEGKGCILVVNKWDLVKGIAAKTYTDAIIRRAKSAGDFPIIFASAKTGKNVLQCLDLVEEIAGKMHRRIQTSLLNKAIGDLTAHRPAPRGAKIFYIAQKEGLPLCFLIFASKTDRIDESYISYIKNGLRKRFDLAGVPIKIELRKRS